MQKVKPLAEPNTTGKYNRTVDNVNGRPTGNSSEYLTRRIARDNPAALEEMKAGKYPSVRAAAARAAGVLKEVTGLDLLKRAWAKAHTKSGFSIPASKRAVGVGGESRARPLAGILSLSPNPAEPLVLWSVAYHLT